MGEDKGFKVYITPSASKKLGKLPRKIKQQITDFIKILDEPFISASRKLQGRDNTYRVRIGDYRILYKIYIKKHSVVIINVEHRKQAYK
ncbi:type II toxin-antitoxin system RelE/ParE family toxin [Candidatus Heimdallarchaeota archaeon]|nr:MAG: type II toxin-antitoxin system RelE/ParE family toxin [Candidatus Heimdallarchaeota archaeon]